jgi:hypothetical protein
MSSHLVRIEPTGDDQGFAIRLSPKQVGNWDLVCALKCTYPRAKFITGSSASPLPHVERPVASGYVVG